MSPLSKKRNLTDFFLKLLLNYCLFLWGAVLDIITNFPYTCYTPTKRDILYICYGHCHITMPKSK